MLTACQTPNNVRRFDGSVITYTIYLEFDRKVIRRAFDEWNKNECITLIEVPQNGMISVYSKDLKGNYAGMTYDNGVIHLDSTREWDDELMYKVALHEVGHALGLDDINDSSSIMCWKITKADRLSNKDKKRIKELYK